MFLESIEQSNNLLRNPFTYLPFNTTTGNALNEEKDYAPPLQLPTKELVV